MGALSMLALLITHPMEFRILLQYHLWHDNRDVSAPHEREVTGWDRETMRRCWYFLDMSSRSFAAVIKQLEGELARVLCLYYLVLRGLDTIEDDMTLPDETKQKLLRQFHEITLTRGWTFTESGPNEADRQLLVEYDKVVEELLLLDQKYLDVIIDICKKMEVGMADYAHKAHTTGSVYLEKVEEYDLYCHYVAGLVGEGITGLMAASGKEAPYLASQLELSNSMGLFLQKTNIIRDFREDVEDHRYFWPREIWGSEKYGKAVGRSGFKEMKEMYEPGNEAQATWVQSAMILDALRHATDSLDYLSLLKSQSVFNFCAIPQSMAIATLELCFMNPAMFQRNIKIRKAEAASLIMRSTNPRDVAYIFREYARRIHHKAVPEDPSFVAIAVACGKIEQWCESHYPSFVHMSLASTGGTQGFDTSDVRSIVAMANEERDRSMYLEKRKQEILAKTNGVADAVRQAQGQQAETSQWELLMWVGLVFAVIGAVCIGVVYAVVHYLDS
ncbi:squalene synthase [Panus rudis PR-1116 ss-1]|nr:squalene synthase [Panus rudis PR-1116 ss-1]